MTSVWKFLRSIHSAGAKSPHQLTTDLGDELVQVRSDR